ncbi:MAG: LysR family transcriptional regulator [Labrys sp. (in: a-proteobacteria)]
MQPLRRVLPSLDHLTIFDAAARHGSFTRAATEIGITQASVSYAIKALENELGVALFSRGHRAVVLTDAGERLAAAADIGLGHIGQAVRDIRRFKDERIVTLSVSTAFAAHWLMPRLPAFRERFPAIELRVETTNRDLEVPADGATLALRWGAGVLPFYGRRPIAIEEIYPVCTAEHWRGFQASQPGAGIEAARLINLDEPYRPALGWKDWFQAMTLRMQAGGESLRFTDYALVLQAALDHQGVALGWSFLVGDLVARGQLIRPVHHSWVTGRVFDIAWSGRLRPDAEAVLSWLTADAPLEGA